MNPFGWVEIPVSDLDRAENFYKTHFGFEMSRQPEANGYTMSWFPMTDKAYGAAGTLMLGEGYTPSHQGTVVYFSVEHVAEFLTKTEAAGVTTLMQATDIGEHGWFGWIQDSEGNRIAVHSMNG